MKNIFCALLPVLLAAASAFAAVPDIEIVTPPPAEHDMPRAVLKNASDLPELAEAIEAYDRNLLDHAVGRLAEYRERSKGEIDPAAIHYDLSEIAIDRADERAVSLRAIFQLRGIGAVREYVALTATIDCATLEELTPDAFIADKAAFVDAAVRAIADEEGIDPALLRDRYVEASLGTIAGDEPEQLAVSVTESAARVTYCLIRGHIGVVDVSLDLR